MLNSLKFVQGAVAKKDFLPALTHFVIEKGTVRGYNGTIALSSPLPFDITCKPKAESLVRAIANCKETVQMSLTANGRLLIRSGKFRAHVDCIDGDTPHAIPEGEDVPIDGAALLQALKAVSPFIGEDASRPWANGVLLHGQSAFATNNVIAVEYWIGAAVPRSINIPRAAVKEILRIDEAPIRAQLTETSLAFHYSDGRWLRTQLFSVEWPDVLKILDRESNPTQINTELFEALEVLKPFTDKFGRIAFRGDGRITTHNEETEGAAYEIEGFNYTGIYSIDMLFLLQGIATAIDWTTYPSPCMFFGERLRGAIVGMRQ